MAAFLRAFGKSSREILRRFCGDSGVVSNLWGKLSTLIAPKDLNIPSCVISFYPLTVFEMYLHMVTGSRSNTGVRVCKQSCHPRLPSDKGLTL